MVVSFVDTSALLKLYVPEAGSLWMEQSIRPHAIVVSALVVVEVGSSLSRRSREGSLSELEARAAWRAFRRELRGFDLVPLDTGTLQRAANLTGRSPVALRALDAIQLQSAIHVATAARVAGIATPTFVTSDVRLAEAAMALGLTVENPIDHP